MTETHLLTLVHNPHGPLQNIYMGKTHSFVIQCGPIIKMRCHLLTNLVTLWVFTHFVKISLQLSLLMTMDNSLTQTNLLA